MANTKVEAVDFEPEDDDLMDEDGAVDVDASPKVEAVDFEPEDDDLMDKDGVVDVDASPKAPIPKLKFVITGGSSFAPKKIKGRGFREAVADFDRNACMSGRFDSLYSDGGPGSKRFLGYVD
ncbi:unnamed protein product [Ilex paraguariensis]|uniref:Uncharacterized protein n=1 Tax=Ilex paraguariensis TaxID=185542 RepID=A0ABC8U3T2_9AQUA